MRKTKEVTITAEGRDKGKRFLITEMPATQAEMWGIRALGAASRSGVDVPDEAVGGGMAVIAAVGLRALLAAPFADVEPLLDEMMGCVARITDTITRALIEDDIEEVATRVALRDEVLALHVGFSLAAVLFRAVAEASPSNSSNTSTSAEASERSSPAD